MSITSIPMRRSWLVWAGAGLICLAVARSAANAASPASTQPAAVEQKRQNSPRAQQLRVYPLRNASAIKVKEIIERVAEKSDYRVVVQADLRVNALIVAAAAEDLQFVEGVIQALDRPVEELASVRVFVLKYLRAQAAEGMLRQALSGEQTRVTITAEPQSNRVVVSGSQSALMRVESLLRELDVPATQGQAIDDRDGGTVRVRVVWIADVDDSGEPIEKLPELAGVAEGLKQMGMSRKGLRVVAQTAIQTLSTTPGFMLKATPMDRTSLAVNGEFKPVGPDGEGFNVRVEVLLSETSDVSRGPSTVLCNLNTTVPAADGQPVLMGMAPVRGMSTAFVLQVTRMETARGKGK